MHLRLIHIAVFCLMLVFTPVAGFAGEEEDNGNALSASGLPVPRFVVLKFDEVNLRTGPGSRYPIRWVYKHKYMPMEVIEEFGHWRKLRDIQGDEGWAHKSQLSGTRMAIFREDTALLRYPETDAPPMIRVKKGVIGQLLECDMQWCEVQVQSYKCWVQKQKLWGVYPREII